MLAFFHVVPAALHETLLASIEARLDAGGIVWLGANHMAPTNHTLRSDDGGDRNCRRPLADGTQFDIVSNEFTVDSLHALIGVRGSLLECRAGDYFWWVCYAPRGLG